MANVKIKLVPDNPEYGVTKNGEVISYKYGKEIVMKPSTSNGYEKVSLKKDGETQNWQVHRLVATLFKPNPNGLTIVNHKDGNKLNNKASNLEWVTRKQNAKHYVETIKPKTDAKKKEKTTNDILARLRIIKFAESACTSNPELFQSVSFAALDGFEY